MNYFCRGFYIVSLLLFTQIFYATNSHCAAWLRKKGETEILNTITQYQSGRFFNSSGNLTKSNVEFKKKELNIYYEKGVTDNITIGYNSFTQEQQFIKQNEIDPVFDFRQCGIIAVQNVSNVSVSVVELELFLRKKLYQKDQLILSVEPSLKLPCLLLGGGFDFIEDTTDAKIKLLLGYGFQTNFFGKTQNNFINSEVSYRKRHAKFADQLKIDNTYGMHLNEKNMIMAQAFGLLSLGEEDFRGVIGTNGFFTEDSDFYSLQLKASYVRKLKKNSIQFSYSRDILGKNSGQGSAFSLSLWQKF